MKINFEERLIKTIKQKLLQNGYLIVPRWGAFFLESMSARFSDRQQIIHPPFCKILFNPNINYNDGILIINLSKILNLSYFEVQSLLCDVVDSWKTKLILNKNLIIEGFGNFTYEDKNTYFKPTFNFVSPEFYGLQPVSIELEDSDRSIIFTIPDSSKRTIHQWVKAAVFIPLVLTLSLLPTKMNHQPSDGRASLYSISTTKVNQNVVTKNLENTVDTLTTLTVALNPEINLRNYYKEMAIEIIKAFQKIRKLGIYEYRLEKKVSAFQEKKFFLTECGGYGNQIVIQPNGMISNCPATTKYNIKEAGEIDKKFRIWNTSLIKNWRKRLPLYNSQCLSCKAINICGGGCPWRVEVIKGNVFYRDEANCIFSKKFLQFLTSTLNTKL